MSTEPTPPSLCELRGIIKMITSKPRSKESSFVVTAPKMKQDFPVNCSFFCPVKEGDLFSAICELGPLFHGKQMLRVVQPPFVLIGTDKPTIIGNFMKCLRGSGFGAGKAYILFNFIEERSRHEMKDEELDIALRVSNYLEYVACKFRKLGDPEMLNAYTSVITVEQADKLLTWWYKNVSLRKLYLFGLTNKDIRNCKMDLDKIYKACISNPLTLYPLSKDKCKEILSRQNKKASPEDEYCSDIARKIYDCYENKSWIGVPSKNIMAEFPEAHKFKDKLCKEYGIVMDPDTSTIYLPYMYKIEMRILKLIQEMKNREFISSGAQSVTFTRKDLSDDQKLAIQGALTDSICFITGTQVWVRQRLSLRLYLISKPKEVNMLLPLHWKGCLPDSRSYGKESTIYYAYDDCKETSDRRI